MRHIQFKTPAPPKAMSEFSGIMAFLNKDDANKEDMLVPGSKIEFTTRKTLALPTKAGTKEFSFNAWSFDQMSAMLKIPSKYLESCPITGKGGMKDQIEARMQDRSTKDFLLRVRKTETEDGVSGMVRAILPGNYTAFDNRHLVVAVQRAIAEAGGEFSIEMHNATDPKGLEKGLHMRLLRKEEFGLDIAHKSDMEAHKMGFHCLTSEIGANDIRLDALVQRLICLNGMMGWGDSEVVKIKHRNLAAHEVSPQIQEGVLASLRQEAAVKDMLERVYNMPVKDPAVELQLVGRRMKANDHIVEMATQVFTERRLPPTKFSLIQAFTDAAKTLPLQERVKLEEAVGRTFFGTGRVGSGQIVEHASDPDVTDDTGAAAN